MSEIIAQPFFSIQTLRDVRRPRLSLHPLLFSLVAALWLSVSVNLPFLQQLQQKIPGQISLQVSVLALLFLLNWLLLLLFSFKVSQKPALLLLCFLGAVSHYFITRFGIVIDRDMLQNAVETDVAEASAMLTSGLLWSVTLLMALPLLACRWISTPYPKLWRYTGQWLLLTVAVISAIVSLAAVNRAEFTTFFRNFKEVKQYALPLSPLVAGISWSKAFAAEQFPTAFLMQGQDATQPFAVRTEKPRLIVLVLGETARAAQFSLNGYSRQTNPELSKLPVVSFHNVSSCGTATAHSVPCMFSNMGRELYEEKVAKNSSNVLDILQYAAINVSWLDNNSGCKGVCARVDTQLLFEHQQNPLCKEGQCHDEVLLQALEQELAKPISGDRLIVLHQLGSHGPEYFKRSLPAQKQFKPECTDKQLQNCSQSNVVNAYDNSILATDQLLAAVIRRLAQQTDSVPAMLYLSDHGESLGENGVYLHGMPYWMAPATQTKVPMIWWMSDQFSMSQQLSKTCLPLQANKELSHDHLFHSLLGLFKVRTTLYRPELDFLRPCMNS
ncbi:sulfatase [Rheinheimera sp. SA_1]|uniref:phosphoethanolamine transferase n=1 Tax=Rheinheimera sp. SA_1 TaxID=1827365 RepID=UPI0007FD6C94|nr:phosphoethanolamine--lipid A transferase [Rheinheimera sp. SA_1]OBP14466.1 sulfatase [Rheinheimera sp. SA_1]